MSNFYPQLCHTTIASNMFSDMEVIQKHLQKIKDDFQLQEKKIQMLAEQNAHLLQQSGGGADIGQLKEMYHESELKLQASERQCDALKEYHCREMKILQNEIEKLKLQLVNTSKEIASEDTRILKELHRNLEQETAKLRLDIENKEKEYRLAQNAYVNEINILKNRLDTLEHREKQTRQENERLKKQVISLQKQLEETKPQQQPQQIRSQNPSSKPLPEKKPAMLKSVSVRAAISRFENQIPK